MASYAMLTNVGRNKEAAALANATPLSITAIAWGDGTRIPAGGETALENEQGRKHVAARGVTAGALNTAFFEVLLAEDEGPFVIREAGLFDTEGDMIAIAYYDPPVNKPLNTVSAHLRINIVFSDLENLIIRIDASTAFVSAETYTPEDVLEKLLTVDGHGSGLDADKLDGLNASAFVRTSRKVIAGTGLSGGGGLHADRTLAVAFATQAEALAGALADKVMSPLTVGQLVKPPTVTILTSGANATYVTPEGCKALHVRGVGGGAGGERPQPVEPWAYGRPGGGGAGFEAWLTPTPLQEFTYTVGAGGAGSDSGGFVGALGGPGGQTRFGNMIANGGKNEAGSSATASGGDINYRGSPGVRISIDVGKNIRDHPSPPGGSIFGPSDSLNDVGFAQKATVPGAGGVGGVRGITAAVPGTPLPPPPSGNGQDGADGMIVITEFF